MGLSEDLRNEVKTIFQSAWTTRDGQVVPDTPDIKLGNDGVKLEAAILYADLVDSTGLVDQSNDARFAAEIYKTYLHCAAKLIRETGGVVCAYDGDRVMGVFLGDSKRTHAADCALKINWAVTTVVNDELVRQYPLASYRVSHAIGVDVSDVLIARTGVRGANDLVWVGNAANYAAKLCTIRDSGYPSFITERVYERLHDSSKLGQ